MSLEHETLALRRRQPRQAAVRRQEVGRRRAAEEVRRPDHPRAVRRHGRVGRTCRTATPWPRTADPHVVNLSSLELEIAIPEEYAGETRIGTPAMIDVRRPRVCRRRSPRSRRRSSNTRSRRRCAFRGDVPAGLQQNQRVTARLRVRVEARTCSRSPRGAFVESGGGRQRLRRRRRASPRGAPSRARRDRASSEVEIVSAACAKASSVVALRHHASSTAPTHRACCGDEGDTTMLQMNEHQEDLPHRPRRDARARGLLARRRRRRVRRGHGAVGLGQDDVPQRRRPARHLRRRRRTGSTARTSAGSPTARCRASATRRSASSSRAST